MTFVCLPVDILKAIRSSKTLNYQIRSRMNALKKKGSKVSYSRSQSSLFDTRGVLRSRNPIDEETLEPIAQNIP